MTVSTDCMYSLIKKKHAIYIISIQIFKTFITPGISFIIYNNLYQHEEINQLKINLVYRFLLMVDTHMNKPSW